MIRIALAAALLLVAAPLRADEPGTPRMPKPAPSLAAWGEAQAGCVEWRNGCQVCARGDDGKAACSTPGVACIPSAPVCSRRK